MSIQHDRARLLGEHAGLTPEERARMVVNVTPVPVHSRRKAEATVVHAIDPATRTGVTLVEGREARRVMGNTALDINATIERGQSHDLATTRRLEEEARKCELEAEKARLARDLQRRRNPFPEGVMAAVAQDIGKAVCVIESPLLSYAPF